MLLGLQRVSHVPRQPQTVNMNPYINEAWGDGCRSERAQRGFLRVNPNVLEWPF